VPVCCCILCCTMLCLWPVARCQSMPLLQSWRWRWRLKMAIVLADASRTGIKIFLAALVLQWLQCMHKFYYVGWRCFCTPGPGWKQLAVFVFPPGQFTWSVHLVDLPGHFKVEDRRTEHAMILVPLHPLFTNPYHSLQATYPPYLAIPLPSHLPI
jgi:hypothetical protein